MQATEGELIVDPIDWLAPSLQAERTVGVHVSDVLRILRERMSVPNADDDSSDPGALYMAAGTAWDQYLLSVLRASGVPVVRIGEVEHSGLVGTPDALWEDGETVEEWKFTWRSSREFPNGRKFWLNVTQLKTYCYMVGARRGILRCFFVNGDYKSGYRPSFQSWSWHWSQDELDGTWRLILGTAIETGLL